MNRLVRALQVAGQVLGCVQPESRAPADATPDACRVPDRAEPLEIGVMSAGRIASESFAPIPPRGDVAVVLGGNGVWMVAAALRTSELPVCVERVNVRGSLVAEDGADLASIDYRARPLARTPDGVAVLSNVYMVVPYDDSLWADRPAMLALTVTPYGGGPGLDARSEVVLRKSPHP